MLKGSRVLVTGGSSDIGRSLATALAAEGARVVVTGRDAQRLGEVAAASDNIEAVDMLVNDAGVMHFFDVTSVRVVEQLPPVTDTPHADGLDPSFKRMPPDDLVSAFIKGLERGDDEIAPGQSNQLEWMSRLAPGFIFGQLNKEPAR